MKLASHNSLSYVKPNKWWQRLINFTSQCQNYDIVTQYEYGIRLFDIRIRFNDKYNVDGSEYVATSGHGLVDYDIYIMSVLTFLNNVSTKDDPVYVLLNLENLKKEEDVDFLKFKNTINAYTKLYTNIHFCGGFVKHPWRKLIDVGDPHDQPIIEQRNWEFLNFTYDVPIKEKIKRFFANLFHFSPKYWAKKNNKEYKSAGTSAEFLMLDFVQYGDN